MKKIITIAIMYIFYMAQITPLFADDIELYQGGDTGVRPNVMFLLDTSGSMNNTITIEGNFYDPDEIYPGPFRNDRLYFSELPDDGGDPNLLDNAIKDIILDSTIHPDSFKCESKRAELYTKGLVVNKFLQWNANQAYSVGYNLLVDVNPHWFWVDLQWVWHEVENNQGTWQTLRTSESASDYVDCELDSILGNSHGLSANDGKPYMTHRLNNQPYTDNTGIDIGSLFDLGWYLFAYPFSQIAPFSAVFNRGHWSCLFRLCIGATETIFTGNRLNYLYATRNGVTQVPRLYLMGQIISDTVAQYPGLNVGLSRFDGRLLGDFTITIDGNPFTNPITYEEPQGGMVGIEMVPSETNALNFENTIKSWDPWGMTPLTESYFETALYMQGKPVKYGNRSKVFATRDSFFGIGGTYHNYPSVPNSRIDGSATADYQSPVTESCQPNHIIVFSDGMPTRDIDANDEIQSLVSTLALPDRSLITCAEMPVDNNGMDTRTGSACTDQLSKSCAGDGNCANELAYYLSSQDQFDDASSEYLGTQTIKTHAVSGFITDATEKHNTDFYLKSLSETYGGGTFQQGATEEEVRNAFRSIFNNITTTNVSFTAPAVSVNAFNRLELSKELYYSVFEPEANLSWKGNLKQYYMGVIDDEFAVVDADNKLAVDKDTGYFSDTSRSIWTIADANGDGDGKSVVAGGMASRLPTTRHSFTYPSSSTNGHPDDLQELTQLTANMELLNIQGETTDYHNQLITWAQGQNRKTMEDPLHSEPSIITYSKYTTITDPDTDDEVEIQDLDRTLFLGTNSGFLHAFDIDESNPSEHFTFIPKELLHNLDLYKSGGGINANKAYGIDGPITKWHKDLNGDGQVNGDDKAYIYLTLRRGGHSFYALDVTERSEPKLLWEAHGEYPADFPNKPTATSGYENLGQTWGRLEPATIEFGGANKVVLFTSGGYDPIEDGHVSNGTQDSGPISRGLHSKGTTIYMIDALTGEVLWDAKEDLADTVSAQLKSSFPANVAPLDVTGDGLANMVYATDVGGRVWRFDFDSSANTYENAFTGEIIADLNSGGGADNRQIYNEVDVIGNIGSEIIYLSIGTGNRSHPKEVYVSNQHYVLKDTITKPAIRGIITPSDMASLSGDSKFGWRIPLVNAGEKVLARSNTVGDQILFTTFTPIDPGLGNCNVSPGVGRVYKIDLTNKTLRSAELASGGIPPMPMLIPPERKNNSTPQSCTTPGSCPEPEKGYSVLVGTEVVKFDDKIGSGYDSLLKDYWLEKH